MMEIDKITGLPKELLDFGQIAKETQKIKVRAIKRRFGKIVTIISGFEDAKETKGLVKIMKRKLACGGTLRGEAIELQGDHSKKVKEILLSEGYKEDKIDA